MGPDEWLKVLKNDRKMFKNIKNLNFKKARKGNIHRNVKSSKYFFRKRIRKYQLI